MSEAIRYIKKSPWVFHVNGASCNGCDIEILDILTPYHDVERFGIKLVGSPRHADILLVTGAVTRQIAKRLKAAYEATPNPKVVIAIGACAIGGNIWFDSFAIAGPPDKIIPVDIYIPGCPPKPEAIIFGVALALGIVNKKVKRKKYVVEKDVIYEINEKGEKVIAREAMEAVKEILRTGEAEATHGPTQ